MIARLVRISYEIDTKLADSGTFIIQKEDHTLGNIVRMSLLDDRRVLFAGYRIPHPLVPSMNVKIRTRPTADPTGVMKDALDRLGSEFRSLEEQMKRGIEEYQRKTDQSSMDMMQL